MCHMNARTTLYCMCLHASNIRSNTFYNMPRCSRVFDSFHYVVFRDSEIRSDSTARRNGYCLNLSTGVCAFSVLFLFYYIHYVLPLQFNRMCNGLPQLKLTQASHALCMECAHYAIGAFGMHTDCAQTFACTLACAYRKRQYCLCMKGSVCKHCLAYMYILCMHVSQPWRIDYVCMYKISLQICTNISCTKSTLGQTPPCSTVLM